LIKTGNAAGGDRGPIGVLARSATTSCLRSRSRRLPLLVGLSQDAGTRLLAALADDCGEIGLIATNVVGVAKLTPIALPRIARA
jgi:hypothetical protein